MGYCERWNKCTQLCYIEKSRQFQNHTTTDVAVYKRGLAEWLSTSVFNQMVKGNSSSTKYYDNINETNQKLLFFPLLKHQLLAIIYINNYPK